MTNSQIKCFFAVVETGSFSEAARMLFIAQPAVSKQVHTLESDLGVQLFQRSGRAIVPTSQGTIIYRALKDCETAFENALKQARDMGSRNEIESVIRMGCPLFWNTDSAFRPIESWMRKNAPWLEISLTAFSQHDILENVANGSVDVAIHTEDAEPQDGLLTTPFSAVNALLMYSAKSPLAKNREEFAHIENYTLLTTFDIQNPIYHELRTSIAQYLGASQLKTAIMPDVSQVYAYLENPYNIFLASELFLWKSDPQLRYITLPIPRKLFVTRRKSESSPPVLYFARQLINEFSRTGSFLPDAARA